jgi:hypothetical protein
MIATSISTHVSSHLIIHAAAIHASFLLALDSEPARICCGPEDLQFTKDARSPAVCIRDAIDAAKMFTGKHGGNLPADILLDQHRRDVAIASDGYIQL